jgi:hypothetical protein
VELAFLRIDGKGRVAGDSAVHFSSDGGQLCPELNEVLLALQRQTQLGVVLLAFFGPGDARDQVILEFGPAPRMRDGDVARLKPFVWAWNSD